MTSEPQPHAGIEPVSFLLGTWRGEGKGHYPTIDDFAYGEEFRFWHDGRPLLFYATRTWNLESQAPMHSETGFWRPQRDGSIELVLAHTFGCVKIQEGTIAGGKITTRSKAIASTTSAKDVAGLSRLYEVENDGLRYEIEMAFGDNELQNHLTATLRRVES